MKHRFIVATLLILGSVCTGAEIPSNAYWTLRNWAIAFDNQPTVAAIDKSLKGHADAVNASEQLKKWIDQSMKLSGKPARLLTDE